MSIEIHHCFNFNALAPSLINTVSLYKVHVFLFMGTSFKNPLITINYDSYVNLSSLDSTRAFKFKQYVNFNAFGVFLGHTVLYIRTIF